MMKRYAFTILLLLIAVVVVAVYFLFDPSQSALFPRCPFLMLTGLKCPGCGSQRAIHSLLQCDIVAAWHYNAFMVTALPAMALYSYAEIVRTRLPKLYGSLHRLTVIWGIFAVVVLWWVLRNVFGW